LTSAKIQLIIMVIVEQCADIPLFVGEIFISPSRKL